MNKLFIGLLTIIFTYSNPTLADISSNSILANSVIKASDINQMFEELNSQLEGKGISRKLFTQVQVGQAISKSTIISNFAMINEVSTSISLGSEIKSSELNSAFSAYSSAIALYQPMVNLQATIEGEGKISIPSLSIECNFSQSPCELSVPESLGLNLLPIPSYGFYFKQWGDDCEGELDESCYLFTNNNKIVKATFEEKFNKKRGLMGGSAAVDAAVELSDGSLIISTFAESYNGQPLSAMLVKLNPDKTINAEFSTNIGSGPDQRVRIIEVDASDRIVIAGDFGTFNGQTQRAIIRLLPNGQKDSTFDIGSGAGEYNYIQSLEIHEGKIYISGSIDSFNGTPMNGYLRLNDNGSIDNTFTLPSTPKYVQDISVNGNKILLTGELNDNWDDWMAPTKRLSLLDLSGNPLPFLAEYAFDFSINSAKILDDGKILVGGRFNQYNSTPAKRIARLNSDGSLDSTFDSGDGFDGEVFKIKEQTDGKIMVLGDFNSYDNNNFKGLVRINSNGSVDGTFKNINGLYEYVDGLRLNPDNTALVHGYIKSYNGNSAIGLIKVKADGEFVYSLGQEGFDSTVSAFDVLPDGKIIASGLFSYYKGKASNIVKLDSKGNLDSSFVSSGFSSFPGVKAVKVLDNGKILVAGNFSSYNGSSATKLIRLNSDGQIDPTFNVSTTSGTQATGINGSINAMSVLDDGKILIGGSFTSVKGVSASRLARLNSDGTVDMTFTPFSGINGIEGNVNSIAIQSDGKILIAGTFTSVAQQSRRYVARVLANGGLDSVDFGGLQGFNEQVETISFHEDLIYVGGRFSSYKGAYPIRFARLDLNGNLDTVFQSQIGNISSTVMTVKIHNNKIYVGGGFSSIKGLPYSGLVRLNLNGSIDSSFDTTNGFYGGNVLHIGFTPDNKVLVGGAYSSYKDIPASFLVKLNQDGSESN